MALSLGQVAYDNYCAATGGKSLVSGAALPTWDKLAPEIRDAWEDAAFGVADYIRSGKAGA